MVGKNDATFRSTPHKHKLNFMRGTKVFKVTADEIPMNHFDFMHFQEILLKPDDNQMLDVIGHVVEKNEIKEKMARQVRGNRVHCTLWDGFAIKMNEFLANHDSSLPVVVIFQLCKLKKFLGTMGISNSFFGSKLLLNASIPEVSDYIERMDAANVELTQGVSQMTGPVVVSLEDDLLQTPKMTIEDLIESTQACELDMDAGWFYQACTSCASRITFMGGQLYCGKCKLPRTVVPRFKVHLQVIDNTGSITFVMFDKTITQVIGRTAQDLLDGMNNERTTGSYPQELDVFVDKRMLFKIEVADANLYRNWRNYNVKKLTDDEDIINRFTTLHGINVGRDADDPNNKYFETDLGDYTLVDVPEGGDSTNNEEVVLLDTFGTPASKPSTKISDNADGAGASATKGPSPTARALTFSDSSQHSPSKNVGKRVSDVEMCEVATLKEIKTACRRKKDSTQHSSGKGVGKRFANVDGGQVSASKESKVVCMKIRMLSISFKGSLAPV
ncbi:replication factor A protein [Trifolium medium]|uniref:Replication factor A protein n=1 Tax=Trifolium medium TaxID=97028 RepID=A0A392LWC5_9FABA|nr:replication factor A protein [Trifolium medium]